MKQKILLSSALLYKLRFFTELVGDSIIPKKYRKNAINYLEKAGVSPIPYFMYGVTAYIIVIIAAIIDSLVLGIDFFGNATGFIKIILFLISFPVICLVLVTIVIFCYKLYLDALIYRKTLQMEDVFPEFLSELAINLKAGQSLEEAMANSMEKEFGYLNDEIKKITKKVKLGADVETAVKEFTDKFNSDIIEETFELILISLKKGGETAQLVDRIYDNIDMTRFLKKRAIASVGSYKLFISAITLIIAPAMFALAFHLLDLIRSITNKVLVAQTNTILPVSINAVRINDTHFIWFSIAALVIIAMCTGMIISVIKSGEIKGGYKQIFLYAFF
jgi:archaellum biogenesis protein FlaJ (TadC family)